MRHQQLDALYMVLHERAPQRHRPISISVVYVGASVDKNLAQVGSEVDPSDSVFESSEAGDVLNINGKATGDEISEEFAVLRGWSPDRAYSLGSCD